MDRLVGALADRVAIVTGGGRGIGAAVSERLAREGAAVVINDFGVAVDGSSPDASVAEEQAARIVADGGTAVGLAGDIADFDHAGDVVKAAISEFGRLDIVVNVAGILRDRMIFNMSPTEWDDVMRVHLRGTFNTTRHATAHWREVRDPDAHNRIVNFTSDSGLFGNPGQPNYAAAKLGIVGLTLSCSHSLYRYGVRVNAVSPAVTDSRMIDTIAGMPATTDPAKTSANVASIVAYLASPRSSWCTGRVLGSNGYRITLFSNPKVERELIGTQPWSVDALGDQLERSWATTVNGAEGRYGERGVPRR